ncbi:hypothetical protein GCK72_008765 [Caenorhabditis remanei]|uniref:Pru domain-containing protein n=1 Tax=Caenorhabditis remanei TaxID=31234 RepID=A0A6A5H153_CAERE|nr:hypothetical protein GCK72_008765 [Caenorhabditis remanei]KAF1760516.1 hypothetical protein GCK72_008765 [Caenorhabditis remanei]
MSFCTFLARIFIFFLNLAQTLVGLTVIALTLWIRFDKSFESEIRTNILRDTDPEPLAGVKSDIRTGIIVAFWIIIGFSIANVIIGFVGVIGAVIRSKYLLAPYFLSMVVLFLLEIAVGITALVKRKSVRRTVKEYVFDSFNMNSQPDVSAFTFRYNCCGADNLPNVECFAGQPTCSSAVWDRLDFTMMIFGIVMLIIVVLQALTALITVPIIERERASTSSARLHRLSEESTPPKYTVGAMMGVCSLKPIVCQHPDQFTVSPEPAKGFLYVVEGDGTIRNLCWYNFETGEDEHVIDVAPGYATFQRVRECTDGFVFIVKFADDRKHDPSDGVYLYWLQEDIEDKDTIADRFNSAMNNPFNQEAGYVADRPRQPIVETPASSIVEPSAAPTVVTTAASIIYFWISAAVVAGVGRQAAIINHILANAGVADRPPQPLDEPSTAPIVDVPAGPVENVRDEEEEEEEEEPQENDDMSPVRLPHRVDVSK